MLRRRVPCSAAAINATLALVRTLDPETEAKVERHRIEAKALGRTTYQGALCRKGHSGERYVFGKQECVACVLKRRRRKGAAPRVTGGITRNEARANWEAAQNAGLKTFMGRPCLHAHSGERYVSNKRRCVFCERLAARRTKRARLPRTPEAKAAVNNRAAEQWRTRYANDAGFRAQENARAAKRDADKLRRTPKWADLKAIEAVYEVRERVQEEWGFPCQVDHVIPLRGRKVSGLHVACNLQIIPDAANARKGNRFDDESQDLMDRAHRAARNSVIGLRLPTETWRKPTAWETPAYVAVPTLAMAA